MNASEAISQLINLHKVDAFADPKGAHSMAVGSSNKSPDVILIDIGGNRELKGVVNMIHWVQTAFTQQARVIIVKSESLVEKLEQHTVKDKGKSY
jgi:NADPH:quinone reductase-like Zn-dependent oxidoreductase